MVKLVILIKKKTMKKGLKILKKNSHIEQNLVKVQDFMNNILIY